MAKVCHKALSAVLSVVLAAGLLPCLAWGEEPAASVSQQSIQFGQTIAAGENHSAAIKTDGSLWMWGANGYGQLGDGTNEDKATPVKIMDGVASVSLGAETTAAIKKDGSLWTWGNYECGVVGNEQVESRNTPAMLAAGIADVCVGSGHTLAVGTDGALSTWGFNEKGELGDGTSGLNQDRYVPAIVMGGVALPNGLAPLPSPSDVIPSDSFTVAATFKVSGGSKYATTSVNWDDAWFNTSSYTYNHSLATTAAVLSASAYANGYVKEALRDKLGFDAFDAVEYHPSGNDYKGNYDQVGYSIETRMTANGVPIVAVVVRGTPGNGEWLSNLNVADTRKGSSQETHEGFERAADEVLDAFTCYVKENNIDFDKARILITGHSRGASVANILGAQLDEGKGNVNGALTPSRVYDFTFESPTTTLSNNRGNWVYDNIFNILNPEDVITRVPLCEWGYGRYGEDLVLPSRSNTNDVVYKQLLSSMNEYFKQFSGETFRGYTAGTLTATTITSDMMSIAPTTWAFYHNYVVGTPPRYFLI